MALRVLIKAYGYNDFVDRFIPKFMFVGSIFGGTYGALQFHTREEYPPRLVDNIFGFVVGSAMGAFAGGGLCLGHPILPFLTIPVTAYSYQWYKYKKNNTMK